MEAGPALESALAEEGFKEARVEVRESDLVIAYPAAVKPPSGYVAPRVLVEFGGRSSGEPAAVHTVECDAGPILRDLAFPTATPRVMEVERAFWEKATAAHVFCLQGDLRGERFSRHWYDLACLHHHGVAERSLADRELARRVADHKAMFFREKSTSGGVVDCRAAVNGGLCLVPGGEGRRILAEDYDRMSGSGLLPVGAPSFDEVMVECAEIQVRANAWLAEDRVPSRIKAGSIGCRSFECTEAGSAPGAGRSPEALDDVKENLDNVKDASPGGQLQRQRQGGDMSAKGWRSKQWDELSPGGKVLVMILTSVQISLAVSAWADLAARPAKQIRGRKATWAAIIAVNFIGPLLYFRRGRRRQGPRRY